jgi:hypothetical protein
MRDFEFRDFLFCCVPCGIWGDMRGSAIRMDMSAASFLHMQAMKTGDNLIWVNL